MYTYKIRLHKETEGGFTVTVPALSGCITYGEDVDDVKVLTTALACGSALSCFDMCIDLFLTS